MANLVEYAKLSKAVYHFETVEKWLLTDQMNGDIINDISDNATKNRNFRAALYIHQDTQEMVIAIAGSDFMDMDKNTKYDPAERSTGRQTKNSMMFCNYIMNKYPDRKLTATGHSLGGSCAAYLASNYSLVEAYMFNSSRSDVLEDIEIVATSAQNRINRYYFKEGVISGSAPPYKDDNPLLESFVGEIIYDIISSIFDLNKRYT